jgi:predicted enzyme related to lactoylglutathione lyase
MPETTGQRANRPSWVELSSSDAAASRDFYARLFGWNVEVSPDPQYGGYAIAKVDGHDVAGIGPTQMPGQPTAWGIYIGTDDVDALTESATAAGGSVLAPPFDVGDQGRMAVFQDPSGGVISAWQATAMRDFLTDQPNTYGWGELNARGLERAVPFYERTFGWSSKASEMGEGAPPYTEFLDGGESIAGAQEMQSMVPAEVPSFWQVYFNVDDVDESFHRAVDGGATAIAPPADFPGGRYAIVADPQGAAFGLLRQ